MSGKSLDRPKALRCVFAETFHGVENKQFVGNDKSQKTPARAWDDIRLRSVPKINFPYSDSIFYNALKRFLHDMNSPSSTHYQRLLAIAFFIRTTPDPFDDLDDSPMFDSIKRDKKYELELPQIYKSISGDSSTLSCKQEVHYDKQNNMHSVVLNTQAFYKWSITNGKTDTVRRFMGLYCMNLLRAISKAPDDLNYHIKVRVLSLFGQIKTVGDAQKFPRPSEDWIKTLRPTLSCDRKLLKRLISLPLEHYFIDKSQETGEIIESFKEYAFTSPLAYAEMYPLQLWLEASSADPNLTPKALIDQLDGYKTLQHELKQLDFWLNIIESLCQTDDSNSEERKIEAKLWKFSRLFDYSSFLDLSLEHNCSLTLFLIGILGKDHQKRSPINSINIPPAIRDEYLALGRKFSASSQDSDSDGSIEVEL